MALSFEQSRRIVAENSIMTIEASMEAARPVVDSDEDVDELAVTEQTFTRSGNYAYRDHKMHDLFLKKKLEENQISSDEYKYIVVGKEV
jgi:hypothetical protein